MEVSCRLVEIKVLAVQSGALEGGGEGEGRVKEGVTLSALL